MIHVSGTRSSGQKPIERWEFEVNFEHMQISAAIAFIVCYAASHVAAVFVHVSAPKWVMGFTTTSLSVLGSVLVTVTWNQSDSWRGYLGNVVTGLVASFLSHQNDLPKYIQQVLTPHFGIGRPASPAQPAS